MKIENGIYVFHGKIGTETPDHPRLSLMLSLSNHQITTTPFPKTFRSKMA